MPNYDPNACKINHHVDLMCVVCRWGSFILALLEITHCFIYSGSSPFYIYYYIPVEYQGLLMYLFTCFITSLVFAVTSINLGFIAALNGINFHIIHIVSDDIRCNRKLKYRSLDTLRTGHNMRITYRSLEILHLLQLESTSMVLYPMNTLMIKMIVFCGSNLIKYHKFMHPLIKYIVGIWSVGGLLFWGFVLEMCGYLALYSQRAITSWKYHNWGDDAKVMSRFKRSCRPMRVSYQTVFTIKRLSVLKFFRGIGKKLFKAFVAL